MARKQVNKLRYIDFKTFVKLLNNSIERHLGEPFNPDDMLEPEKDCSKKCPRHITPPHTTA